MDIIHNHFPLVLATSDIFCNRTEERAYLKANIAANKHTLLLAPRRYGKSSLLLKVMDEIDFDYINLDLFTITNTETFLTLMFNNIEELLANLLPPQQNLLQKLSKWFQDLNPTIELSLAGQKIKFQIQAAQLSLMQLQDALLKLDQIASGEQKRAVIILDEFQQLHTLQDGLALEGVIRHVLERSQSICYLFSGSTRHILEKQFEDKERPLYHSCHKMKIDRISRADYEKHLNKAAVEQWQQPLDANLIDLILDLSQCHSYYINLLCSQLWMKDKPPTIDEINLSWKYLQQLEKHSIVKQLIELSDNQRTMLIELAKAPTEKPTGKDFLLRARLSSASANQVLKILLEKDLVMLNQNNYFQVLDPLMEACIKENLK